MSLQTSTRVHDSDPASRPPAWAAVWALSLGVASLNTAEMLPMSLLTPMAAELGVSEGLTGQAVSASAIVAVLTSLVIAPLIRTVDRRRVLLVLAAAQVLSNLAVALAPSFGPLMAARLVLGIAVGGFWGLSASLALRLVPTKDVPRALSMIFGGGAVAGIAAAPLGAYLGGQIGWRGVFLAATGLALVALLTQIATLPSLPGTRGGAAATGLWRTLRLPQIAAGMVGVMMMFGGRQTYATYLRPYLEEVPRFGVDGVSLTLLVLGIASFAGTVLAAPLLRRDLRRTLAAFGVVQGLLVLALLAVGSSQVATLALVATWGFAAGVVPVGWSTWLTRTIPDSAEAGGGILVAAIQGSMLAGALVGGVLIDRTGILGPVLAAGVILLLSGPYTLRALRPRA